MKRTTVVALVAILVLVAASGAYAWGGRGGRGMAAQGTPGAMGPMMMRGAVPGAPDGSAFPMMGGWGGMMGGRHMMGGMHGRGMTGWWGSIEIPQEIRDKQVEMQKLALDMQAEIQKRPLDRAKVEELYKRRVELRNELGGWMMKQRLDMVEKLQK
ncbi:MAG: hypothetical protein BWY99_00960 [Synergistetes bacterium ADurb.BinA166]|jgi:hypothetical protein|nr:MAG: hypothetical protein BWY99_00960 [Synergistetes bacterium ADurb.BinA166]